MNVFHWPWLGLYSFTRTLAWLHLHLQSMPSTPISMLMLSQRSATVLRPCVYCFDIANENMWPEQFDQLFYSLLTRELHVVGIVSLTLNITVKNIINYKLRKYFIFH